jgi:hypothetical protein
VQSQIMLQLVTIRTHPPPSAPPLECIWQTLQIHLTRRQNPHAIRKLKFAPLDHDYNEL